MQYANSAMEKSGERSKKINNSILNKFFTKDNFARMARGDYSIYISKFMSQKYKGAEND